jgi:rod shape-determining protein MreC
MIIKKRRISEKTLFVWFLLTGVIFLIAPESVTAKLQLAFARFFQRQRSPITNVTTLAAPSNSEVAATGFVSTRQYNLLRNQLANVQEWLNLERQKVEKLTNMRDRPVWKGADFVLADIIKKYDRSKNMLIISRGTDDGIKKGHYVLGDNSIIGIISDTHSRTAEVKLITDPECTIAVKITDTDVGSIMQGAAENSAKILMLPYKHKITTGLNVCAKKKPGLLDTPMIVGTITKCKRDAENPLFWDITVVPACDIKCLNNVTVIIMNPENNAE